MRIGVFGGSFDPVHYGHLLLAELCRESCALDEVRFVPASIPPHKRGQIRADDEHRLAMLRLAIGGQTAFSIWEAELARGGVSYTVETLRDLREDCPQDNLFFLMGSDSLLDLPNWRDPSEICELATIVVVERPGNPPVDFSVLSEITSSDRIAAFQESRVSMPQIDISSSAIRQRVATSRSIRFQTPRAVEQYIRTARLYEQRS